jgi:hypothetical protein
MQGYRPKAVFVKTRFYFAKDLHALLWLGANSESFSSSLKTGKKPMALIM